MPAKTICTGRSAIGEEPRQPVDVREEEVRPLVRGEAPREADRERVRVEALTTDALAAEPLEEPRLRPGVGRPEGGGIEPRRSLPPGLVRGRLRLDARVA